MTQIAPFAQSWSLKAATLLLAATMACPILLAPIALALPADGHRVMVSGPTPYGPEIAREIQASGGNAVDAAVAILLSMAVTHPYYASFGGGGFAMVRMKGKVRALDFRETAPLGANMKSFEDKDPKASRDGGLAVGVPGIPAGLWMLHHEYGKLKWNQLFETALTLANKGFHVSGEWVNNTSHAKARFNNPGVKTFYPGDGAGLRPGDVFSQPLLAKFLNEFRNKGLPAFYAGIVAKDIIDTVSETHGLMTIADLKNYKTRWLEPLKVNFAGSDVYLMPPPSSGGVVIAQALKIMDKLDLKSRPEFSADEYHLIAEVEKQSFKGRVLLGDPDFVTNPISQLFDPKAIDTLASEVKLDRSAAVQIPAPAPASKEKAETTHLNVMTENGDAIAVTVTLNGNYGSALVTSKNGIALNNEMDDFTTHLGKPNMFGLIQGDANSVRPGARPLSSMSPTLSVKDGKTQLAVGAPGGPRIITGVLQVLYRVLQRGDDVDTAIQAPRVHDQYLPDILYVDAKRFAPEVLTSLRIRGHTIEEGSTAKVYAIQLGEGGLMSAAFDSRGEGAAGGD